MLPALAHSVARPDEADDLGWTDVVVFETFGARIGIRVNDPQLLPTVRDILPPYATILVSSAVDTWYSVWTSELNALQDQQIPPHRLYIDGHLLIETPDIRYLLDNLESALNSGVAVHARTHLFIHAGVVSWKGNAIVIPGRSMSGKTELVAALVKAGATYYSDECAPIDDDGRVHPYPKPLFRRRAGCTLRDRCSPEMLGGRAGVESVRVGLIVVSTFKTGTKWQPRTLSPGEAILRLLEHTALARSQPARALTMLTRAVAGASALSGPRGAAADVVEPLLSAIEGRSMR